MKILKRDADTRRDRLGHIEDEIVAILEEAETPPYKLRLYLPFEWLGFPEMGIQPGPKPPRKLNPYSHPERRKHLAFTLARLRTRRTAALRLIREAHPRYKPFLPWHEVHGRLDTAA
jgi:hypothetical protein